MRAQVVLIALLLLTGSVDARQAAPTQQPASPAGEAQGVSAGEIQRLYDAYALVQAQEALQLSDDHYVRFVARLKALQETRRRHVIARNRILQDLRRLSNAQAPVDETAMRDRLKALRDEDDRGAAEVQRAYDAVDELLDVRQRVKFRLFEEQMDRKRLDLLMRARQNARGRRGGG